MDPNRTKELWDYLSDDGFRTTSPHPEWFKSVVVSMLLSPGTDGAIKERAHEVLQALGLEESTLPKDEIHPSFHLGRAGPRNYHEKYGFWVGQKHTKHTFDNLGVHCATHDRPWNEYETIDSPCTPSCRYGMRICQRS